MSSTTPEPSLGSNHRLEETKQQSLDHGRVLQTRADTIFDRPLSELLNSESTHLEILEWIFSAHPELEGYQGFLTLRDKFLPSENALGRQDSGGPRRKWIFPIEARGKDLGRLELVRKDSIDLAPNLENSRGDSLQITLRFLAEILWQKNQTENSERDRRALSLAAASTVHEIRNPLGLIQLQLDILKLSLGSESHHNGLQAVTRDLNGFYRDITFEIQRVARHLEDLSTLTQSGASVLSFEPASADLVALLHNTLDRMRPLFDAHKVKLILQCEIASLIGQWDCSKIEQILINLLSNALKYGDAKPVTLSLSLSKTAAIPTCTLAVHDNGPGVPQEVNDHIHQGFYRASNARGIKGLGLGLYICQKLVSLMGGRLVLESTPHAGTTVTVALPLLSDSALDSERP